MQSPITPEGANLAEHACASCKARKRKCDKKLPKCSSCLKKGLRCDYSKLTPDTTHVLSSWPYNAVTGNDWPAEQHIDIPTLTFLDSRVLEHGQLDIPRRTVPIPAQIIDLVGDIAAVCATAAEFFQTIHPWMPFISKKRFYGQHLKQVLHSHEDITLLFLCMKLITQIPPSDPRCTLYSSAKHFYLEVEGSGISTIQVLQAGILISLYEIGNAIYPAAFLSLGTCARFASVLGINRGGLVQTSKVTTLVELEERRRVWWAIVILDRYVNVGCPGRPLAAEDPKLHDLLPTNDVAWDQGTVLSEDSFTLGSPLNDHMSKFALLCQASRLLGLVLSHVTCDKMVNQEQREANEIQLSRTIFAMINASSELESPDYDQIAFCYCALMALHEPGTSPNEKDEIRRRRATAAMDEISERMISSLEKKIPYLVANRDKIPPWGLHLAYRSYVIYMQKHQRDSEMNVSETLKLLKKLLSIIDGRWKAAGAYLKIIEAREAMSLD